MITVGEAYLCSDEISNLRRNCVYYMYTNVRVMIMVGEAYRGSGLNNGY